VPSRLPPSPRADVFSRLLRGLHWLEDAVLVSALASMLVFAVAQILMRNLFDAGLLWTESFLRTLVLWVAMLGALVATRDNNHISIDVLARYLPDAAARWLDVLTSLAAAAVCGAVGYISIELLQFEYEDGTIAFGFVPVWVFQLVIPAGFLLMAVRFVLYGLRRLLARG